MIYLDNAMATRPSERGVAQMIPMLTDAWGNPLSPHRKGQELFPMLEQSIRELYRLVGASDADLVIFTSSGTEAVNQVYHSVYTEVTLETGKNQFITSATDEAPSLMCMSRLEKMNCVGKMAAPNDEGVITRDAIADLVTPRTALVSLSWANGLTGTINEVQEIAALCKERGILLHLEASHVLGKLFFDLSEVRPDYLSFEGSILHAPRGTGALYVQADAPISPFLVGGLEQGGYRAGPYSAAGLVALGQAAAEAIDSRELLATETARLRDKLDTAATPFFKNQPRLPHITSLAFPGVSNEALLYSLNRRGLFGCIGGGAFQQIALILGASGVNEPLANSAISFALSRETTESDIDQAIAIISDCYAKLQATGAAFGN